jgi:hypothetical protein
MFQVAPVVVIFLYLVIAAVGAIVGTAAGLTFSSIFRSGLEGVGKDAVLGAVGSVLTVIGSAVLPWPRNTVFERLGPGVVAQSTLNRFQHPYVAAVVIALALPALHQFFVFKRTRGRGVK